ncbi:alpha-galactosidase [Streptomyces sp. NPDC058464]|uniref:alpha-galactosidase n=1 Tax=Streptomyces sp. NPDC058464 TaxID=3346511 RepID=UPI0036689F2B
MRDRSVTSWSWGEDPFVLRFAHEPEGPVRMVGLGPPTPWVCSLPLVEVEVTGEGRAGTSGKRHVDGSLSRRLRYVTHDATSRHLTVRMHDPSTDLHVTARYALVDGVLSAHAEITAGSQDVRVEQVSSFTFGGLAAALGAMDDWESGITLWTAANPWSGEHRWHGRTAAEEGLYDVGMTRYGQTGSKNRVAWTSTGSWPSSERLPMGWIEGPDAVLAWQIEHNGSWLAELGDRHDDLYLLLAGPGHRDHHWSMLLTRGETFTTVPTSLALGPDRDTALGALTRHRRAGRRPHPDTTALPVVFNDFMNCLMGEPTTVALLPLIEAAAESGCEYFCVDAGWYDDERAGPGPGGVPGWWDTVGQWQPSPSRFPGGLGEVTRAIKDAGMLPGLWLEPEVVGVRSPVARALPDEAFFRRDGARVAEWGRHQLDLAHPAARAHLDATVDRLVADFGIGYLKLDYNIDIGAGTDAGPHGPGHGLLRHNRAYLSWLDAVLERHPGLVIEGCAAGGMRTDPATLARVPVQSLTDQQDFRLVPAIAVNAPAAVPPEQGAMWAYPDPSMSDEEIVFTMVSAMLGRIHLSGRADLLDPRQRSLVKEALRVYRTYRRDLAAALPSWPLGLADWRSPWLALAMDTGPETLLAVWRRDSATVDCAVPVPAGTKEVREVYPVGASGAVELDTGRRALRVLLPERWSARLFRLVR